MIFLKGHTFKFKIIMVSPTGCHQTGSSTDKYRKRDGERKMSSLTHGDRTRASCICIAEIICQQLNSICSKIIFIPKDMVMRWPTSSLNVKTEVQNHELTKS